MSHTSRVLYWSKSCNPRVKLVKVCIRFKVWLYITSYPGRVTELKVPDTNPFAQEHLQIYESFDRCLSLRDKYMQVSLQRLGDDPRDHDGYFTGLDPKTADVSGVRPDVDISANTPPDSPHRPWRIYPRPPPPHWHWTPDTEPVRGEQAGKEEFMFETCEIPVPHDGWSFEIDETGVYQVYNTSGSSVILCNQFQSLRCLLLFRK